ncbi:MAG: ribosome-associated translation inhibitor RaiA [Actinomycetota bacterium]|nr:ribosome-associated translation inhibitor RaiA [Candidatus Dormibacteraeota bacterium]MDQ6915968.1 ribosome-associated translation inhibitor RaiA [Actinomycetota bacterium]
MKVVVHDRTAVLPVRVRAHAEQRLLRVARHFDRVVQAEVVVASESRRSGPSSTVQITVLMDGRRHPLAQAHEEAADPQAALDLALDKVDRQVVRLKERIRAPRKRAAGSRSEADDDRVVLDPGPERLRVQLQPQTLAEAEAALDDVDHPFYIFQEETSGEVSVCYRRADGRLAVIEAVLR